jgi:hypothetical protein
MPSSPALVPIMLLMAVLPVFGQQRSYCDLVPQIGSVGALPAHSAADDVIDDLIKNGAQIDTRNGFRAVGDSTDKDLRQQVAAAEICNATDRYIFFSLPAIEGMQKSGAGWAKYFVLAHEIAHHINGDTLVHHEDANVELLADENAAKWLTRLGASMPEIKLAVDALKAPEFRKGGYPSHCERVAATMRGYNAVARDYNRHGASLDLYQEGNCVLTKLESPPAAVKPTATLSADRDTIKPGESVKLTWTTTDAINMTITPDIGSVTAQGTTKVTPLSSTTYVLTGTGPGGSSEATVHIVVNNIAPAPYKPAEGPWGFKISRGGTTELVELVTAGLGNPMEDRIRVDFHAALYQTHDFHPRRLLRIVDASFQPGSSTGCYDGLIFTLKYTLEDTSLARPTSEPLRESKEIDCNGRDRDEIEINAIRKTVSKAVTEISR